jgi:hypothetical protein
VPLESENRVSRGACPRLVERGGLFAAEPKLAALARALDVLLSACPSTMGQVGQP